MNHIAIGVHGILKRVAYLVPVKKHSETDLNPTIL